MAAGRDDVLAEAASIEAGSWYAWRPKPQPMRPNPARDPEFRNDPRVQPTRQIIPARNLGSDPPVAAALINSALRLNRHRLGLVFCTPAEVLFVVLI